MRYFTRRWCTGALNDEKVVRAAAEYAKYVDAFDPPLPAALRSLTRSISVHDGRIRRLMLDRHRNRLRLELRCGDLSEGYFDLTLEYRGVDANSGEAAVLAALARDTTVEALHDEIDRVGGGRYVHRILFSSMDEVVVEFDELALRVEPRRGREFRRSDALVIER
jgi:hypothetical protein